MNASIRKTAAAYAKVAMVIAALAPEERRRLLSAINLTFETTVPRGLRAGKRRRR